MKREVQTWTVRDLYKERGGIIFPEYQRQPNLWSDAKKRLLIDSILKDIDIPKLYFNKPKKGDLEVVDGQQRLWAIWDFLDGKFTFGPKALTFEALPEKDKRHLLSYEIQVTTLDDASDDYLRELFIRLQLGLLLVTGEKLNAASGAMRQFVFDKLSKHPFIKSLGVPQRRFANETLCAQIAINSFTRAKAGYFARTRYEDLQHFFEEYASPTGNDLQLMQAKEGGIPGVLNGLGHALGTRAKDLRNRSYVLSTYLLYEELTLKQGLAQRDQKSFADFTLLLWKRLKEEAQKGLDRTNRELYEFETLVSSAPGEKYQIERRHERMKVYYEYFKGKGRIVGDR